MSIIACVHHCFCPSLLVSIIACVHHCLCPSLLVSIIACVHHCLCPSLLVSIIACVHHCLCPSLLVSIIACVHHCLCPSLLVSIIALQYHKFIEEAMKPTNLTSSGNNVMCIKCLNEITICGATAPQAPPPVQVPGREYSLTRQVTKLFTKQVTAPPPPP